MTGGLYALLDADALPRGERLAAAAAALDGGAGMLQYRDKQTPPDAEIARALAALCRARGKPFIVNDHVELARAVRADGVHLGRGDGAIEAARAVLGAKAIIGATCHNSVDAAGAALAAGADYISFGRFYASRTKGGAPPADPAVLAAARARFEAPIVAIGGVNADNGAILLALGADWLCAAHAVFGADDIGAAAARLAGLQNKIAAKSRSKSPSPACGGGLGRGRDRPPS